MAVKPYDPKDKDMDLRLRLDPGEFGGKEETLLRLVDAHGDNINCGLVMRFAQDKDGKLVFKRESFVNEDYVRTTQPPVPNSDARAAAVIEEFGPSGRPLRRTEEAPVEIDTASQETAQALYLGSRLSLALVKTVDDKAKLVLYDHSGETITRNTLAKFRVDHRGRLRMERNLNPFSDKVAKAKVTGGTVIRDDRTEPPAK